MNNNIYLKYKYNYTATSFFAGVFGANSISIITLGINIITKYTNRGRHDVVYVTNLYEGFNYVLEVSSNIADGVNDTCQFDLSDYTNSEVIIYNKWGSAIYKTQNKIVEWNANFKGEQVASGTYYYLVKFGEEKPQQTGSITIIR